jgi:hypothetical protein
MKTTKYESASRQQALTRLLLVCAAILFASSARSALPEVEADSVVIRAGHSSRSLTVTEAHAVRALVTEINLVRAREWSAVKVIKQDCFMRVTLKKNNRVAATLLCTLPGSTTCQT